MWEYVKGSEADFEGAPEWALYVDTPFAQKDFKDRPVWFSENYEIGSRFKMKNGSGKVLKYDGQNIETLVIAERRKVEDLQSRTNDAHLQQAFDTVQRPAHYNQSGIECIDAIAAAVKGKSGIEAACVANVIKYLWRYELKNGVEDVRKAQWYLDRLVKELSK